MEKKKTAKMYWTEFWSNRHDLAGYNRHNTTGLDNTHQITRVARLEPVAQKKVSTITKTRTKQGGVVESNKGCV